MAPQAMSQSSKVGLLDSLNTKMSMRKQNISLGEEEKSKKRNKAKKGKKEDSSRLVQK